MSAPESVTAAKAGLFDPAVMNESFEESELSSGSWSQGVGNPWSVFGTPGRLFTVYQGGGYPNAAMGSQFIDGYDYTIYQQIGTYTSDTDLQVEAWYGPRVDDSAELTVALLAGPAYADAKIIAAKTLTAASKINKFTIDFNTVTQGTTGDPLFLQVSGDPKRYGNLDFIQVHTDAPTISRTNVKAQPVKTEFSDDLRQLIGDYNTVFDSPSQDETGNVPLGNGNVGMNLWVEEDGDLLFYVSRNDAWAEAMTLYKLGRIRLSLNPNPFRTGYPYRQELKLIDGRCDIEAGREGQKVSLSVLVDSDSPTIYVKAECEVPTMVTTSIYNWRIGNRRDMHEPMNSISSWTFAGAPDSVEMYESADQSDWISEPGVITTWHRNEDSIVPLAVKWQHMEDYADIINDPFKDNTFGMRVSLDSEAGAQVIAHNMIRNKKTDKNFTLRVTTHAAQTPTLEEWQTQIRKLAATAPSPETAIDRTSKWWNDYWNRSWIFISDNSGTDKSAFEVTRAYVLGKFQYACQMRSKYAAHFQGGIFTVDPKIAWYGPDPRDTGATPDYRFYGTDYWWQNVRFMYLPQMAQGSFDFMKPFFSLYLDKAEIFKARAKQYYNAEGIYFQECMSEFGLPAMRNFGWGAEEYSEGYTRNIWQQALEYGVVLLDYCRYTENTEFLKSKVIPWCTESLRFYDTRFPKDDDGRIRITPTHAVETYWVDVVNDQPSVAGLHYICRRLLALPANVTTDEDREYWKKIQASLPPIPKRKLDGRTFPDNAESYNPQRFNFEAPDLYTVFPFRIYGLDITDQPIEEARYAWKKMPNPGHSCWYQTGILAARLGLTKGAKEDVVIRSRTRMVRTDTLVRPLPEFRFPGYMGSPHDWCPDHDGPGNMMSTLQEMLLQNTDDGKMLLLPAWPKEWDVKFKLHAAQNTVIEGTCKNGQIEDLQVTPKERLKDVVFSSSEMSE
ncbi:DUF5703 domain-containing protein [Anaerohalosphaera lusitana]|uniref:DUF5703 domain-containing protein n=1 Tax=Anaerohalosphaera lusitana TaxID=1936003 RepID=UPI0011BA9640|nr:DUF5703 domain-containing protein [Anaerohalosphaera lusitana]